MYILHIFVEGMPTPFGLRFKTAAAALDAARPDDLNGWIEDSFCQRVLVTGKVLGVQILDIGRDMDVQVEIARMQNERNQAFAKEQQAAAARGLVVPAGLIRPN